MRFSGRCNVCGCSDFVQHEVLWQDLIVAWGLCGEEIDYVNRQQGLVCVGCNNNLRSLALAQAIVVHLGKRGALRDIVASGSLDGLSLLEVNEAGGLTQTLRLLPGHKLVQYPDYDLMNLGVESTSYDLVIHSDTLEHVENPVRALEECWRIIKDDGACIFTVPIIIGRLTRSREGLSPSYHGVSSTLSNDLMVQYEFGADLWVFAARAGFTRITKHILEFPSAIAIVLQK